MEGTRNAVGFARLIPARSLFPAPVDHVPYTFLFAALGVEVIDNWPRLFEYICSASRSCFQGTCGSLTTIRLVNYYSHRIRHYEHPEKRSAFPSSTARSDGWGTDV